MKRVLIVILWLFCISACAAAEQAGFRVVHFPKDHAVGRLKIRDSDVEDEYHRGLISLTGWTLIGQAQGDVNIPAGKDLRLEVYEDATDFSFLADLKPDDLQVLMLEGTGILDEELVYLKHLSGLKGLDFSSTNIQGDGLVHLAKLSSLENLDFFNSQITDEGLAYLPPLKSLRYIGFMNTRINGSGLKYLKGMTSLIRLDIALTDVTDDSLVHLTWMSHLRELHLYDTNVSDAGLAHLKSLRSLEVLILSRHRLNRNDSLITDKGLAYLSELNSLKRLYLARAGITDTGLVHLGNIKTLELIYLDETHITGEGIAFLKDLPVLTSLSLDNTNFNGSFLSDCKVWSNTLKGLSLDGTKISDEDLVHLEGFKALKYIGISGTPITDAGLARLSKISSLESLWLDKTRITDEGLMTLKDLPNLRRIYIDGTLVTNTGLENFKRASASKSIEANVSMMIVTTKEKGVTDVKTSTPMPEIQIIPILGKPIPDLEPIKIDFDIEQTKEKSMLICFFDMNQRPSRNCLQQLSTRAQDLTEQNVIVVAVQASNVNENELEDWIKENNLPFPVGIIESDEKKTRASWGVKALPWLILTDKQHIVTAEGVTLEELDDRINKINDISVEPAAQPNEPALSKSFLNAAEILAKWESTYGSIRNMKVTYSSVLVDYRPPVNNPNDPPPVKYSYVERIEDGIRYHLRYSTAEDGFEKPENLMGHSFDGEITREYFRNSGSIVSGLIGRNTETMNDLKYYMLLRKRLIGGENASGTYLMEDPNAKPELSHVFNYAIDHSAVFIRPELEPVAGQLCHVVDIILPGQFDGVDVQIKRTYWLAHDKGMCLIKYIYNCGDIFKEVIEVEQIAEADMNGNNVWYPVIACGTMYGEDLRMAKRRLTVTEFVPNVEVDENTFRFDFPPGTRVVDRVRDILYTAVSEQPESLLGKTLPELNDFETELVADNIEDKNLLVCFFDVEQRPSRNCLKQLSEKAGELKKKDIIIVALQATKVDKNALDQWIKENNIPFPFGIIESDEKRTCAAWGIKALPWLILTDKQHIVIAEGIILEEIDERILHVKD